MTTIASILLLALTPAFAGTSQGIRAIDIHAHLLEGRDDLHACAERDDPIHFFEVEYADLTGDGRDEAVVEAATCWMETGGADIVEVFRLTDQLELESLDHYGGQHYGDWEGCCHGTPRLDVVRGTLTRWYSMFAKDWDHPKHGRYRVMTYRWNGGRFVLESVLETDHVPTRDGSGPLERLISGGW